MKIGIVLAGGFARGSAQMGFLKGLFEHISRNEISLISCSSIGGFNGLALSNNTMEDAERIYRELNFADLSNLRLNFKNKLVDKVIERITNNHEKLEIPMYVTGTCLNTISSHFFYLDENSKLEDIFKAINITVTFPFVNGLFRKEYGRFYLDGGSTENIPVYPFKIHKVDLLIILHSYPRYLPPADLIESDTVVVDVDVTARIRNDISTYSFSQKNLNELFDGGYEYGKKFASDIFKDRDLKKIKERAQEFIRDEIEIRKHKRVTITASVFFNKLQHSRGFKS